MSTKAEIYKPRETGSVARGEARGRCLLEASGGAGPADALILDCQPPEQGRQFTSVWKTARVVALCYNGPNTLTRSVTGGVQVQSRIPARNPGYRLGSLRPRDDSGDTRHWAACIAGAQSTGVTGLGSAPPQKGRPAFPGSWRCSELRPALCQPRSSEPGAPRSGSPGDPASILPSPLLRLLWGPKLSVCPTARGQWRS